MNFARVLFAFFFLCSGAFGYELKAFVKQFTKYGHGENFPVQLRRTPLNITEDQILLIQERIAKQDSSSNVNTAQASSVGQADTYRGSDADRIVGGTETGTKEFPWQAGLVVKISSQYYACGGSLIDNGWILTAAQCVDGATEVYVILGAHQLVDSPTYDPNRQYFRGSKWVIHPNWNINTLAADIALVKLNETAFTNDYVRPIAFAQSGDSDHVNDTAVITGWGSVSDNIDDLSNVLRKASVLVIANSECSAIYGNNIIKSSIICSKGLSGQGFCLGDGGGPLSYRKTDGTYIQIGIASFTPASGCQPNFPHGYTRVRSYSDWISKTSSSAHLKLSIFVILTGLAIMFMF